MKKQLLVLPLLLAACAPGATRSTATGEQTVTAVYEVAPEQVFDDVLATIAADPGVPAYRPSFSTSLGDLVQREASGPWTVTSSDRTRGTIAAEAKSPRASGDGSDTHRLNVVLTGSSTPLRTQIAIRFSERAASLVSELNARLGAKYNRLPSSP